MTLRDTLPPGTVVGEFEIRRVLGQGGFGIVYEAWEPMLERRVALKEYFLQGFSRREGQEVLPADAESVEMFDSGMARFIREARLLSMLNERTRADGSLVAVYRVFQQHRTAFMAMKLYEGQTMRQTVLAAPEQVSEAWLVSLLQRMLDGLEALHSLPGENLVHRDVSPDNIILQPDGRPVLLDFGATRKASDAQTSLIYKPGYSPIEQYTDAIRQGPWTDLYALCGTAYFAIARQSPMPAVDRYAGAQYVSASERGAHRFSPEFLAVVDHGMAVLPEQRFQSAAQMRQALAGLPTAHVTRTGALPSPSRAAAMPTATFVAPPATTPLTGTQQGVPPDDETTRAYLPPGPDPAGIPTTPWAPTPMPTVGRTPAPAAAKVTATAWPGTRGAAAAPGAGVHGLDAPEGPGAGGPGAMSTSAMSGAGAGIGPSRRPALWAGIGAAVLLVAVLGVWRPWSGSGSVGPLAASAPGSAASGRVARIDPSASGAGPGASSATNGAASAASSAVASDGPASTAHVSALPLPPVPGLACREAEADWACVLDGLARLGNQPQGIALRITPAEARIGQPITMTLNPAHDGVLQLLFVDDQPDARLQLLFPNHLDRNNRLRAQRALALPRRPAWDLVAKPPKGRAWAIAVLSDTPLKPDRALQEGVTLRQALQAFQAGRPHALLGVADCTPGGPGAPATGAGCPKTLSIQPADFIIR